MNWITPYTEYLSYGHIQVRTRDAFEMPKVLQMKHKATHLKSPARDVPGGPRLRRHLPAPRCRLDLWVGPKAAHVSQPNSKNRSGIITDLIKTLQKVHIKKKKKSLKNVIIASKRKRPAGRNVNSVRQHLPHFSLCFQDSLLSSP